MFAGRSESNAVPDQNFLVFPAPTPLALLSAVNICLSPIEMRPFRRGITARVVTSPLVRFSEQARDHHGVASPQNSYLHLRLPRCMGLACIRRCCEG